MASDKYLFPTGAIRTVEKKLIDANEMERMIDAPNVEYGFKIFNELSFSDELLDIKNPRRYKEVLVRGLSQRVAFLKSISPDILLTETFLAHFDFHNLKSVFKAKYAHNDTPNNLFDFAVVPTEKLIDIILKEGHTVIAGDYGTLINQAGVDLEKSHTPYGIDAYFDKAYFNFVLKRARELDSGDLLSLIKTKIDICNIKIVIRSKLLGKTTAQIENDLIDGGSISVKNFLLNYEKDKTGLIESVSKSLADSELAGGLSDFLENNNLWYFEKILDNYLIRKIKVIKMKPHGPASFVAYLWGKENAIRNICIIMSSKINGVDPGEIKTRIRELY